MKIVIGYPPLDVKQGTPQLSQNRQFQWTSKGPLSYSIYPVVLASAATILSNQGNQVFWLDGIAEKWTYAQWLSHINQIKPEMLVIETKTPVIKQHWEIINNLKQQLPHLIIVLLGDHVTARPKESLINSKVDYVITGGDYDFMLKNLVDHLRGKEKLEPGFWFRKNNTPQTTGKFILQHDLDSLPPINRALTHWQLYSQKNTNYYRTPGTYTMFARDCWWGKCTFCSWTTLFPGKMYRKVSYTKALNEIEHLVNNYHVKEIMDDSGTFPTGDWLRQFCLGMIKRQLNNRVKINCNMRFNTELSADDYKLMGRAGFRFILYGLESFSQTTLDKINKNLEIEQIEKTLVMAKAANLKPHITVMVGYPWETKKDLNKTITNIKRLVAKGLIDSLQATIVIPYPGTPLFDYCQKNKLLTSEDWKKYDMRYPIIKTSLSKRDLDNAIKEFYSQTIWNKRFLFNTIKQLSNIDGIKYVSFQAIKYLGKLVQFSQ